MILSLYDALFFFSILHYSLKHVYFMTCYLRQRLNWICKTKKTYFPSEAYILLTILRRWSTRTFYNRSDYWKSGSGIKPIAKRPASDKTSWIADIETSVSTAIGIPCKEVWQFYVVIVVFKRIFFIFKHTHL